MVVELGIALQNYHQSWSRFPSGTIDERGPILNIPMGFHHNWIEGILPQLGEGVRQRKIDPQSSVYDPVNAPVRALTVASFRCPSAMMEGPVSNYAAAHHHVEAPIDENNTGVFFLNSRIRRDDLVDGQSYSILLGEKKEDVLDLGWMSGTPSTLRNAGRFPSIKTRNVSMEFDTAWAQLDGVVGADGLAVSGTRSSQSQDQDVGKRALPNQADLLELAERLWTDPDVAYSPTYVGGFDSAHIVVQFLFADGSVRIVDRQADGGILERLVHRNDGELVPMDAFLD
jgi:hypothetical protein